MATTKPSLVPNLYATELPNTPSWAISTGMTAKVIDSSGAQTIKVKHGGKLIWSAADGENIIQFVYGGDYDETDWHTSLMTICRSGTTIIIKEGGVEVANISAAAAKQFLDFDSEDSEPGFALTNDGSSIKLNGVTIGTDEIALDTVLGKIPTDAPIVPNDTKPPVAAYSNALEVSGDTLTYYIKDVNYLDTDNLPLASNFKVLVDGAEVAVTEISGGYSYSADEFSADYGQAVSMKYCYLKLKLASAVTDSQSITLSYTDPTVGNDLKAFQDRAGNDIASFTNQEVINNTPDTTPPIFSSAVVNGDLLTITMSDKNELDWLPPSVNQFSLDGTTATVTGVAVNYSAKTVTLTLSESVKKTDALTVSYTDPTTNNDRYALQDQAGNDVASFTGMPVQNMTKDPVAWTLLLRTGYNFFVSDGTASGTGNITSYGFSYGWRWMINGDQTLAILQDYGSYRSGSDYEYEYNVYATDGSLAGTRLLASNISMGYTVYQLGDQIVISDGGSSQQKALVTDGTISGTQVLEDLNLAYGVKVDSSHQALWHSLSSPPYGWELFRTVVTADGVTQALVKDIYSGSGSAFSSYVGGTFLPNGKLIFSAYDGVNGWEPWVSDGTEAGTFMLGNLYYDSYASNPSQFTAFGDKIAFVASVYRPDGSANYYGTELVFTDGTTAGTTWLDIYPDGNSSSPNILGIAGGRLYFTATNASGKGIYSTDGITFTRLADINSSASLLGWTASKAFFRVSDTTHGDELWAANLSTGTFALVKDILPGSGSALASISNTLIVGEKFVFTAYTSAMAQAFFLSDGTEAGTLKIGNAVPLDRVTLGETLVFGDAAGIHAVDASSSTPTVSDLVSGAAPTSGDFLQSDTDQAFFRTAAGDLYVSDGTLGHTIKLASNVASFKVVADDALYFIQQSSSSALSLGYSDGTVAGTRYIENLPGSLVSDYNLENAVAIKTVGMWSEEPSGLTLS